MKIGMGMIWGRNGCGGYATIPGGGPGWISPVIVQTGERALRVDSLPVRSLGVKVPRAGPDVSGRPCV